MATYTGPNGWTADSVVGAINAAAQAPITADTLLTTTGKAKDSALESRKFMNPYTGVRDPVLQGSVYAQGNTPAWLAGEVAALNAEQALRRAAQAEIFNKVFEQAQLGGNEGLPWLEVLRAAVLQPGVEAGFGSAVIDPQIGAAALADAKAKQTAADAYRDVITAPIDIRNRQLSASQREHGLFPAGTTSAPSSHVRSGEYEGVARGLESVARAVVGTNPFATQQGYIGSGRTTAVAPARFSPYFDPESTTGNRPLGRFTPYDASMGVVRPPATNQAYSWGGGYVGPTQFSIDNPAYNRYAGSNFLR